MLLLNFFTRLFRIWILIPMENDAVLDLDSHYNVCGFETLLCGACRPSVHWENFYRQALKRQRQLTIIFLTRLQYLIPSCQYFELHCIFLHLAKICTMRIKKIIFRISKLTPIRNFRHVNSPCASKFLQTTMYVRSI